MVKAGPTGLLFGAIASRLLTGRRFSHGNGSLPIRGLFLEDASRQDGHFSRRGLID